MVSKMAKNAIPPSDILISLVCPCDEERYVDSPRRCRRLEARRSDGSGSGIALYLYASRDTAPLMAAMIPDTGMIPEGRYTALDGYSWQDVQQSRLRSSVNRES